MGTRLFGMEMQSAFILGSGPLGFCADSMIEAHRQGIGAVVTKTIRDKAAINPLPHIHSDFTSRTMLNAELWSDIPGETWVDQEIPKARAAGVNVIASIGHTPAEARHWVPLVDQAGAQAMELVSYSEDTIVSMAQAAVDCTRKPVIVKISPNWTDPLGMVPALIEAGVAGFTAIDSIGPVLRIDIRTGKSFLGSRDGRGWLTGSAIKPIALHYIARLAAMTELPIIGLGGVVTAKDAVEMSMAGAQAIGLCTTLMLQGLGFLPRLQEETHQVLEQLGYHSLAQTYGIFNARNQQREPKESLRPQFSFDSSVCIDCGRCRTVCSYQAQHTTKNKLEVDPSLCRLCGLCVAVCPSRALSFQGGQGNLA